MQPQPLREIDPRGRAGMVEIGGHDRFLRTRMQQRPPRAVASSPGQQAGVGFAKPNFAPEPKGRAKSWTFRWVADAKRSATGNSRVVSCCLHTLLAELTTL